MIKELTELVMLAEQSLPGAEELLRFYSRGSRDVEKLYYAIQSATYRTEADAIQRIGMASAQNSGRQPESCSDVWR